MFEAKPETRPTQHVDKSSCEAVDLQVAAVETIAMMHAFCRLVKML